MHAVPTYAVRFGQELSTTGEVILVLQYLICWCIGVQLVMFWSVEVTVGQRIC